MEKELVIPGEVLERDFLEPMGISAGELAEALGLDMEDVLCLIDGSYYISEDLAEKLGSYLGNSPSFWLGLQKDYDDDEGDNHDN